MKVKFSRCNSNSLANVPQVDGQLIYVKDTKEVYMDVGNTRNNISDFLRKNNVTEYTPENDYNPATKKYVDDGLANYVPLRSFPNTVRTTGTTQQFISSIQNLNLATGSMMLGLVRLTDMPEGLIQAEVKVEVYANNVIYLTMVSADTEPYVWTCNSYNYRGWESAYKAQEVSYDNTETPDLEAATVQEAVVEINNKVDDLNDKIGDVSSALDALNGEVI